MKSDKPKQIANEYVHSAKFRGYVGIYIGLCVDILYVVFRTFTGLKYSSVWFLSMAVYYAALGATRGYLIASMRRVKPLMGRERISCEYTCYSRTAKLLFLLNIAMGGMIALMVIQNRRFEYPGYIIYLCAAHTFYMLVTAIISLFKFRRAGMPLLTAAKAVNLVAALMSIMGLQTALIARFSTEGQHYPMRMNALTGFCICVCVILIAVYMLKRAKKMRVHLERMKSLGWDR